MKRIFLSFCMAAGAAASLAVAQTPAPRPAAKTANPAHAAAANVTRSALPPGVPRVPHNPMKTAFSLRYEDLTVGTGPEAEPNKIYKVFYTGYLGNNGRPDDGQKFDSSDDHRRPILDKDGKPVFGDDGKPRLGEPQPLEFPQGFGRLIPGFDQGFEGMRVGGKRRLFIPWQLAYGVRGRPGPDSAHPGIPPKADLIFDIELVGMIDLPTMPGRPMMPPHPVVPPAHPVPPAQPETPPHPSTEPAQPAAPPQPAPPSTPPEPK